MDEQKNKGFKRPSGTQSRIGKDFIPYGTAPDNWPFTGERANPLSSKGGFGTSADYEDYMRQNEDEEI